VLSGPASERFGEYPIAGAVLDDARVVGGVGGLERSRLFVRGSGWMLVGIFAFATAVGLFLQWIILPILLPQLHAGHGLMAGGDWIGFHQDGVKLANAFALEGWRAFELRPNGNFPVFESGLLYFLTGVPEPWVAVPLDALVYASALTAIFNVFCRVTNCRVALIGLAPLVLFPGAIQFYGEIEKDVWAFAGSAWLLFVLVTLVRSASLARRQCVYLVALTFMAAGFGWLVRPYFSMVQLGAFGCGAIVAALWFCVPGRPSGLAARAACLLCCAVAIALFAADAPGRLWPALIRQNPSNLLGVRADHKPALNCATEPSRLDRLMPASVTRPLQSIGNLRAGQLAATGYAGSNVDNDVCFARPSDVVRYLPRALQIALFAPFPDMWLGKGVSAGARAMRLMSGAEMLLAYLLLPGILVAAWRARGRRRYVLIILAVVVPIILLLAATIPNIGTLYRMRYGYLQILVGLGMIGWLGVMKRLAASRSFDISVKTPG